MLVIAPVHSTHEHNNPLSDSVIVVSMDYNQHEQNDNSNHCGVCISCTHCNHITFIDMHLVKNNTDNKLIQKYITYLSDSLSYSLTHNILKPPQYILS